MDTKALMYSLRNRPLALPAMSNMPSRTWWTGSQVETPACGKLILVDIRYWLAAKVGLRQRGRRATAPGASVPAVPCRVPFCRVPSCRALHPDLCRLFSISEVIWIVRSQRHENPGAAQGQVDLDK